MSTRRPQPPAKSAPMKISIRDIAKNNPHSPPAKSPTVPRMLP
jgi:hypothetical protein